MSCGVGLRCSLDLALLWQRPATTAPIGPLAWEPPYAVGVPPPQKRKKNLTAAAQVTTEVWVPSLGR